MPENLPEMSHYIDRIYRAAVAPEQWPVFLDGLREELRLARPSGRPALEAVVTPLGLESSPLFDHRAAAAIFLVEPDARSERPPERLRRIYGLTQTEAEVASRLVQGMRLADVSKALGVSIHTVRGYLKQLFAKTNTHRQAELVRVIVSGPGRIRQD